MSTTFPTPLREGFISPVVQCFTPDVARQVVAINVSPVTQARLDDLASKANEGQLAPAERSAYKELIDGMEWLGTIKVLARAHLSRRSA